VTIDIQEQFGQIDIYIFDQILRGNIEPGMCVLDAGCGYGRNLVHLLREGCKVFAIDQDAAGVEHAERSGRDVDLADVGGVEPHGDEGVDDGGQHLVDDRDVDLADQGGHGPPQLLALLRGDALIDLAPEAPGDLVGQ